MLTLYEPKYEDLWFRQMMLADEDTMSYHRAWGGTIPWPEDKSPSIGLTCSLLSIVSPWPQFPLLRKTSNIISGGRHESLHRTG